MNRRIPSYADSFNGSYNNSTRTISSSSSMISTPSNRKHLNPQQMNKDKDKDKDNERDKDKDKDHDKKLRTSTNLITKSKIKSTKSNVNLVKNKLLNLQKSSKIYTKNDDFKMSKNFIVRRPINMNHYDYSVFTKRYNTVNSSPTLNLNDDLPCIKESQIKAWESAEKISNNLIFDHDSDLSDDDDDMIDKSQESIDDNHLINESNKPLHKHHDKLDDEDDEGDIIKSIPGFTKNELSIILSKIKHHKINDKNFKLLENEEKQELYKFRQLQQLKQEKFFNQYQSLTNKRKIQVQQKKELFNKIFGYGNLLNQEYITNNTSYSSLDNIMNTQKLYHEDKDEISMILDQDNLYNKKNMELRDSLNIYNPSLNHLKHNFFTDMNHDLDYDKFKKLIQFKLTKLYNGNDDDNDDELVTFIVNYLRKCIKDDDNDRL